MSTTYCVYKNKKYPYQVEGEMIRILSYEREKGFKNHISRITERVKKDRFSKLVSPDELDIICSEEHEFKYKGKYFTSRSINQRTIKENKILLSTNNAHIAGKLDFAMVEQFVFEKKVNLNDITELVITRKPLMQFKDNDTEIIIIPQNKIKRYIKRYLYKKHHRMNRTYCIYKGKKYCFESIGTMVEIISDSQEKGFKNYIDITGKVSKTYFSKEVSIDKLDEIYLQNHYVK